MNTAGGDSRARYTCFDTRPSFFRSAHNMYHVLYVCRAVDEGRRRPHTMEMADAHAERVATKRLRVVSPPEAGTYQHLASRRRSLANALSQLASEIALAAQHEEGTSATEAPAVARSARSVPQRQTAKARRRPSASQHRFRSARESSLRPKRRRQSPSALTSPSATRSTRRSCARRSHSTLTTKQATLARATSSA